MSSVTGTAPASRGTVTSYFRREVLTWPNAVTTIRLFCAVGIFAWVDKSVLVFWFALIGGISDILDGWLAKRFKLGTEFGKTYDQWIDWLFGIALMYAIFAVAGITWYDWPYNGALLGMIGAYLLIRTLFPKVETIQVAKIKTAMQFTGGVTILGGYAFKGSIFILFGHMFEVDDLPAAGYLLVWSSIGLMAISLWIYFLSYLAQRK